VSPQVAKDLREDVESRAHNRIYIVSRFTAEPHLRLAKRRSRLESPHMSVPVTS
jgi:hypothetical protein